MSMDERTLKEQDTDMKNEINGLNEVYREIAEMKSELKMPE
ncbi:MAG: hypothetical protein ACLS48_11795 [[Eubacterium] siraeum]